MDRRLVWIAFLISGMTALIYEVVWTRPLQLIFGSTIYAFSTILTTFFVGFALGALLISTYADKTRHPMTVLGFIEIGIGLYGLAILRLFDILTPLYVALDSAGGTGFVRFLPLVAVIITPATLFGMTWPVANRAYVGEAVRGRDIGALYFANSLGSFAGPLAAGFVMIPVLGIIASGMIAAVLNLLVGLVLIGCSRTADKGGG